MSSAVLAHRRIVELSKAWVAVTVALMLARYGLAGLQLALGRPVVVGSQPSGLPAGLVVAALAVAGVERVTAVGLAVVAVAVLLRAVGAVGIVEIVAVAWW